jgi:glutamate-1-semialdehyde 2,1-aminomutase
MEKGEGCYLTDIDGNRYVDFVNNYTSLVLGHCNEAVISAVEKQIRSSSALGAPDEKQVLLAEILCERIPSVEAMRFCNCGTEATLHAMRLARIATGRKKIVLMDGFYHGGLLPNEIETLPHIEKGQLMDPSLPSIVPEQPRPIDHMIKVPINNKETVKDIFTQYGSDIAAVIVEPMLGAGGALPLKSEYLKQLRELTTSYYSLLIFDEIQTFRSDVGGVQNIEDIDPDLTCLGKIIGGGYPVGGLGGHQELMDLFSTERPKYISLSGTFNANPITMVAGLETMKQLNDTAIKDLNKKSDELMTKFNETARKIGVNISVTGSGSIMNIHPNAKQVKDYTDAKEDDKHVLRYLHLSLLLEGVFITPRGMFNLSTAMGAEELHHFETAYETVVDRLKEILAKDEAEHLLR